MKTIESSLLSVLKTHFGYSEFRDTQKNIMLSVLSGRDTLAVMPTGGGKSLCYQVPALILDGLTLVISPLIALMQDQVSQLEKTGIPSLFLNSSLDWETYKYNMDLVRSGKVKLLYCAPETLATERVQSLLSTVKVSLIAIDEAHCISEWGHDFRPEYRQIKTFRTVFPDAVLLALTATATKQVRKDIAKSLAMKESAEFVSSFDRENIFFEVISKAGTGGQKKAEVHLCSFIKEHKNESGIVYCFSRKSADAIAELLQSKKISAVSYHAGLSDKERAQNQEDFLSGRIKIIAATVAFGMGINKADVRFVIHFDLPKSIEQYYQEIGRAGRDGQPARAILYYSHGDTHKLEFFLREKSEREKEKARMKMYDMVEYAECSTCRRKVLLNYFGDEVRTAHEQCCDYCSCGEEDLVDITIPAQKFLSCVVKTGEKYGATYLIDILQGSRQKRILENKHNTLSVWGIGKELSKEQWYDLSRILLTQGYMKKTEDYSVLSLTREAKEALVQKQPFYAREAL